MRVDERNLTAGGARMGGAAGAQETGKVGREASGPSGASGSGDRVEFSSTLKGVSRALASDGAARAGRVASLARAYQSGSYLPDGYVIARGLVSDALAGA
jgi:hypothetical protein